MLTKTKQDQLESGLVRNLNLHGKRIINAGRSQALSDYVIKEELNLDIFIGPEADFKAEASANPDKLYLFDDTDDSKIYLAYSYKNGYYRVQTTSF